MDIDSTPTPTHPHPHPHNTVFYPQRTYIHTKYNTREKKKNRFGKANDDYM